MFLLILKLVLSSKVQPIGFIAQERLRHLFFASLFDFKTLGALLATKVIYASANNTSFRLPCANEGLANRILDHITDLACSALVIEALCPG